VAINGTTESYKQTVRTLSDRIVEAQRPIRVLDAIQWDDAIEKAFFDAQCREQPAVTAEYYAQRPLPFNPAQKRHEFHEIERDVSHQLGEYSPVGQIMRRMCREYQMVVRMLEARGTADFCTISEELYGSASDVFHAGDPTLKDLGDLMEDLLANVDRSRLIETEPKNIPAEDAVRILQERMNVAFKDFPSGVRVKLSNGIVADAAAGSDYIKIRQNAMFSERDLRIMEVHEGWVHLGTTLNGASQPVCTFLSKGPPSSTITQEGLAILMEIFAFASHPARLRRTTNRIRAINMAEEGASFVDVFNFFRKQGFDAPDSYSSAVRVFRGSTPTGGPFTKDLAYNKGFVTVYNYIMLAVRKGLLQRIPLLFCGKTTIEDLRTIAQLVEEGLVAPPKFVPPQFADLNALTAWMCYANFLNGLNLERIESDYAGIL
jgi:uncharacterized protein (TIGR02421 family)